MIRVDFKSIYSTRLSTFKVLYPSHDAKCCCKCYIWGHDYAFGDIITITVNISNCELYGISFFKANNTDKRKTNVSGYSQSYMS